MAALHDLLAVVFIALGGYFGWRRGFVPSLMSLIGVPAFYAALLFLTEPATAFARSAAGMQGALAYAAGGVLAFLLAQAAVYLGGRVLAAWFGRGGEGGLGDSARGAACGAVTGAAYAAVVIWGLLAFEGWTTRAAPAFEADRGRSLSEDLSAKAMGRLARALLSARGIDSGPLAEVVPRAIERPGTALRDFKRIAENPAVARAMAEPSPESLRRALEHPDLIDAARGLGFDKDDMRSALARARERVEAVRDDPELQRALSQPDLQAMIQRGDPAELLGDPRIRKILDKVAR